MKPICILPMSLHCAMTLDKCDAATNKYSMFLSVCFVFQELTVVTGLSTVAAYHDTYITI